MTVNPLTDHAAKLYSLNLVIADNAADALGACVPLMDIDWPCETCSKWTHRSGDDACPDCVDGQAPLAVRVRKLLAVWGAVNGPDFEGDGSYPHTDDFLERLRQVGRDA